MYIAQAFKGLHDGWRYILGVVVVFLFGSQFLGAIPMMVAMSYKAIQTGKVNMSNVNDIYSMFESNITLQLNHKLQSD